jgi:hypothetical protein
VKFLVEDVFVTEGVPSLTFVQPPNFMAILVDIRRAGKPVIIEGQSGTGKTTTVKQILSELKLEGAVNLLTPREPAHISQIAAINEHTGSGIYIIDDFHRLPAPEKDRLANLSKLIAERDDRTNLPKLVIVGINNVGADLIQLVPDVAKRMGIHRIVPGTLETIQSLINLGCQKLNIEIENIDAIFDESQGDYWLTQQMCKTICLASGIDAAQVNGVVSVGWERESIIDQMVKSLEPTYDGPVKIFCRGRRFRPSNDPYFKLLRLVSQQGSSSLDLNELANANPEVKGSINNVKDKRLAVLIADKEECSRYFYYDAITKNFALEDPALFFYIKNLDWETLRERCGFRANNPDYEYDIAISFAGENRDLARFITEQLSEIDISVFYDRNFEDNYLGGAWSKHFNIIFVEKSRLVVVLLDKHHANKVWPSFERECFRPRVEDAEVIPIRLDDTKFVGISDDINGIRFDWHGDVVAQKEEIINIVLRIAGKLETA